MASYWPASEVDTALAVMRGENAGGRPDATNHNSDGTIDRGLFQINSVHARRVNGDLDSLYDPAVNVRVAYQIWSEQGWEPWVAAHKLGLVK